MVEGRLLESREVELRWRDFGILSGYRRPRPGLGGALRSTLRWNNETVNIWSHLIPALVWMALLTREELGEGDWPFLLFHLSLIATGLISAFAHTFNILSDTVNDLCYIADYLCIATHSLHVAIAVHAGGLSPWWGKSLLGKAYLWLSVPAALAAFAIPAASRFVKSDTDSPARLRAAAFFFGISFLHSPLFLRLLRCRLYGECLGGEATHEISVAAQIAAVLFYGTHLPERWFPGAFDFFGNSHHHLHFWGVLGGETQRRGLRDDRLRPGRVVVSSGVLVLFYSSALFMVGALLLYRRRLAETRPVLVPLDLPLDIPCRDEDRDARIQDLQIELRQRIATVTVPS